jgi:hypothetical protein
MSDEKTLAEQIWEEWIGAGYPEGSKPGPTPRLARAYLDLLEDGETDGKLAESISGLGEALDRSEATDERIRQEGAKFETDLDRALAENDFLRSQLDAEGARHRKTVEVLLATERVRDSLRSQLDTARAEVERLEAGHEAAMTRARELVAEAEADASTAERKNERLRGVLTDAMNLIAANRLLLGEYSGPAHVAAVEQAARDALGGEES